MWLLFDEIQIEALFGPTKLMMFSTQSTQPRLSLVQSLLGLHSGSMEGMFRLYFLVGYGAWLFMWVLEAKVPSLTRSN